MEVHKAQESDEDFSASSSAQPSPLSISKLNASYSLLSTLVTTTQLEATIAPFVFFTPHTLSTAASANRVPLQFPSVIQQGDTALLIASCEDLQLGRFLMTWTVTPV
ncbi:hypothetical protein V3481_018862 [Fusarium oxysporum f. sp. vasinfectum]